LNHTSGRSETHPSNQPFRIADPSHQVFLREYITGTDGLLHSTGRLLDGHRPDGSAGGMATEMVLLARLVREHGYGCLLCNKCSLVIR